MSAKRAISVSFFVYCSEIPLFRAQLVLTNMIALVQ